MASFLDALTEIGAIDPMTTFPPAPLAPPQGGMGGLGGMSPQPRGGVAGFLQRPGVNDFLQALGSSLISSPRNAPLSGFGDYFDAYTQRTQKTQMDARDRDALKSVLIQNGASEAQAEQLSYNAAAAELWLKQRTAAQGLASDEAFNRTLAGIGGTETSGGPFPLGNAGGSRVPPLLTDRRPLAIVPNDPGAAPQSGQSLPQEAAGMPSAEGKLNGLYQLRDQYVKAATQARTDDQRARAKLYIESLDKQISREEDRQKPTESFRELMIINQQRQAEGLPPMRLDEWQQTKARSGATNVNMKGENKYDETFNQELAKRAIAIEDQATSARKSLGTLRLMESAVSDPNFYSGIGAGAVTNLKRLANGLSIPGADGIDSIESFNALSKEAALAAMGGSLGSGFSNADRSFVEEQVANLGNTKEGNLALIRIQRAAAERQLEIAKLARAYAEKNGGRIDTGFYDRLSRWAEAHPMFTNPNEIFGSGSNKQGRVSGGSGRANSATGPSRQRATNPETGETVEWDGNKWSPVQ